MQIAQRVQNIKTSPTLAIAALAKKMQLEGLNVIDLSTGEPDFDTPEPIKKAAIKAIHRGFTKYTAVTGIAPLKTAIIQKFERDQAVTYTPKEIIVSAGGKHIFYNLCMAYLNPGDEVIIPAPYWVSYPDMVKLAEATPVIIACPAQQHYQLTAEQLSAAINPKTRLLVINSPANPTGTVYAEKTLRQLGQIIAQQPQLLVVCDDIYEYILMEGVQIDHLLRLMPALKPQTLLMNGVSKTFAMTGWRIGYAAGPAALIQAMGIVQSQSTSNPCSIAQVAAQAALAYDSPDLKAMVALFRERHDLVKRAFHRIKGIEYLPAQGAFYAFVNAQRVIQRLFEEGKILEASDEALAAYLLEKYRVAVVPGSAFGMNDHFRISFATDTDLLTEALGRITQALTN